MPYREARSVAESSEGPTASKSDRTGRNPGMTRLVRRSSAMSGGTALFSLVQTSRQRMRKCSWSPVYNGLITDIEEMNERIYETEAHDPEAFNSR